MTFSTFRWSKSANVRICHFFGRPGRRRQRWWSAVKNIFVIVSANIPMFKHRRPPPRQIRRFPSSTTALPDAWIPKFCKRHSLCHWIDNLIFICSVYTTRMHIRIPNFEVFKRKKFDFRKMTPRKFFAKQSIFYFLAKLFTYLLVIIFDKNKKYFEK